jgi:hypothetical protein
MRRGCAEQAPGLLEPLRRVVPFDACFIGLLHQDRREHLSLVQNGYDDGSAHTSPARRRWPTSSCSDCRPDAVRPRDGDGRPPEPPGQFTAAVTVSPPGSSV